MDMYGNTALSRVSNLFWSHRSVRATRQKTARRGGTTMTAGKSSDDALHAREAGNAVDQAVAQQLHNISRQLGPANAMLLQQRQRGCAHGQCCAAPVEAAVSAWRASAVQPHGAAPKRAYNTITGSANDTGSHPTERAQIARRPRNGAPTAEPMCTPLIGDHSGRSSGPRRRRRFATATTASTEQTYL